MLSPQHNVGPKGSATADARVETGLRAASAALLPRTAADANHIRAAGGGRSAYPGPSAEYEPNAFRGWGSGLGGLEFGDEVGGDAAALADLDALGFGPGPNRLGVVSAAVPGWS